jgi:hypothetical protein
VIQEELIALYYGGAAERLGELRLAAVLENVKKIRNMGQSYPKIGLTLLSRGAKKLSRKIRSAKVRDR